MRFSEPRETTTAFALALTVRIWPQFAGVPVRIISCTQGAAFHPSCTNMVFNLCRPV